MSLEERVAKLEQAILDLRLMIEKELNHFGFYQKLILLLIGIIMFILGGKELVSLLLK
jgi:hypothetical protein